ncbi:MAG: DUF3108 domain-containing protein [Pseudomonadota bacterium]
MNMRSLGLTQLAAGAALAATLASAAAQDHPAVKYAVDVPPSADLTYAIKAAQKGITLSGEAQVTWRSGAGKYSVASTTRAQLLGKILDNRSEGAIDAYGLAPAQFNEKRFRKDPTSATFDRAAKSLSFNSGKKVYPLAGGEQDRASVQWQLAAVARAAPEKLVPGAELRFFVAGRKDAEAWSFKVLKREKVATPMGEMESVHFVKAPPLDDKGQKLDIWLAPAREYFPVKLRFEDDEGEYVDQVVTSITAK